MPESLHSFSNILLFGEEIKGLEVTDPDPDSKPKRHGANNQLGDQLKHDPKKPDSEPRYAKIYGFSYEGHYYDLGRPALFLVHGEGKLVTENNDDDPHRARAPRHPKLSGLAAQEFGFTDDIRVWSYDQGDYTIRMDVETGRFEQLLLEVELDQEELASFYSGQRARVSGQRARVGGQRARVSGQRARMRDRGD